MRRGPTYGPVRPKRTGERPSRCPDRGHPRVTLIFTVAVRPLPPGDVTPTRSVAVKGRWARRRARAAARDGFRRTDSAPTPRARRVARANRLPAADSSAVTREPAFA